MLTNTVNLHEMNRAYVCPKLVCAGTVFLGKHLAGPDATFRSIKLMSAQHPLYAPGLLGASVGKVAKAKAAEATQSPPGSASLLQRAAPRAPVLLPIYARKPSASASCPLELYSLANSRQGSYLCGLHKGNFSPELIIVAFNSEPPSVPSVGRFGIKSSQSKRIDYFIQISERVLRKASR